MNEPLLLTTKEAADICRLSVSGYKAAAKRGVLPSSIPGLRRISRARLIETLDKLGMAKLECSAPKDEFATWMAENGITY